LLSVEAQTFLRYEHLVLLDRGRAGCSATFNALASAARGEWLFILADDDLMLPGCLERHLDASADADIVYAPPLVWGEDSAQFRMGPPGIPAVVLIRKEWWRKLGGYDERLGQQEDRNLFIRAEQRQARFVRVPDYPTWVYRFHGGNKSRS
jgi:GT2 family glycosyltransferase